MKVGVLTNILRDRSFEKALECLSSIGYEMITVGSGGLENLDGEHCDAKELLNNPEALKTFKKTVERYHMEISTIACPANPLHPQKAIARSMDEDLRNCILLAEKLGVDRISTFSGCPGDSEQAKFPNWVTYNWPYDFGYVLEWQWREVAIPYWRELAVFSRQHGGIKIGLEFHPNQLVYNPETFLRLRDEVGDEIGVCLDVSHLFWMGMEPVVVIEQLAGCVWQFHAKDSVIWDHRVKINGVIDAKPMRSPGHVFDFCIPGSGHDMQVWKQIVRALRLAGYDRDLCLEHEDLLLGQMEGLYQGYKFLKDIVHTTPVEECGMNWRIPVGKEKSKYLHEKETDE